MIDFVEPLPQEWEAKWEAKWEDMLTAGGRTYDSESAVFVVRAASLCVFYDTDQTRLSDTNKSKLGKICRYGLRP